MYCWHGVLKFNIWQKKICIYIYIYMAFARKAGEMRTGIRAGLPSMGPQPGGSIEEVLKRRGEITAVRAVREAVAREEAARVSAARVAAAQYEKNERLRQETLKKLGIQEPPTKKSIPGIWTPAREKKYRELLEAATPVSAGASYDASARVDKVDDEDDEDDDEDE
jgi:hypothetical protein